MRVAPLIAVTGAAVIATPAAADTVTLDITIPRLSVAEYHRPYVAVWLEPPGNRTIRTLAVWYDHEMRAGEGRKWLSDMRTWWRKGGRSANIDGVTGATRAPGPQRITIPASVLRGLASGKYNLVVEAAREVGGREVVSVPFQWPAAKPEQLRAKGSSELGEITVDLKP